MPQVDWEDRGRLPFPYIAASVNGVAIRLSEERWFHITKHHPELKGLQELVLRAVAKPKRLYCFAQSADYAAVGEFAELEARGLSVNLVVHYKQARGRDGFIVTAFPVSHKRMLRKFRNWQRLR